MISINSSIMKLIENDKKDIFAQKLFSSRKMLSPLQIKIPRTLKMSDDEV